MKNQKGITLIALVITIIVLLILAGVSIAMLSGPNGLLTEARQAKTDTQEAEKEEKVDVALNACLTRLMSKQKIKETDIPEVWNATTHAVEAGFEVKINGSDASAASFGTDGASNALSEDGNVVEITAGTYKKAIKWTKNTNKYEIVTPE